MIKFLLSIDSQKGREALRNLLKKDIGQENKQLIGDGINDETQGR